MVQQAEKKEEPNLESKLIRKILVPLDGSEMAESALPYLEEMVTSCGIREVVLVSVTETVVGYRAMDDPTAPTGQRLLPEAFGKKERQADRYLNKVSKRLLKKGIKAELDVLYWPPAEAIVGYAEQYGVDLIIMSSHGRSGPSRWAHGSVADKVFRSSSIPVMMVKAPGANPGGQQQ